MVANSMVGHHGGYGGYPLPGHGYGSLGGLHGSLAHSFVSGGKFMH